MTDTIIINGNAKFRGKDIEWEFHRVLAPVGFKWYGRRIGDEKPVKALSGHTLKAAEAAYVKHLEQHQGDSIVLSPLVNEEKPLHGDIAKALMERIAALEDRFAIDLEPAPSPEKVGSTIILTDDDISEDTVVCADHYDLDFLGRQAHDVLVMHRVHVGGSRYYAVKYRDSDGNWGRTEFYAGVTSVCDMVLGYDDGLLEWACGFGSYKEYKAALNILSGMGTFAHGMFAKCAMHELPDFDTSEWDSLVRHLITKQGYRWEDHFHTWNNFIRKAILSFKKWVHKRNVVFHAIEIPLGMRHRRGPNGDKIHGYFAQLDFIITMDVEDYPDDPKPKRIPLPEKMKPEAHEPGKFPRSIKKILEGEPYYSYILPTKLQGDSWSHDDSRPLDCKPREIDFGGLIEKAAKPGGERDIVQRKYLEFVQKYIPYELPESIVRERCIAIVDFKSGKNSYPSHALQLQLQVALLKENFPHLDLSGLRLYNLHVTDWTENESPTFGFSLREKTSTMFRTAQKYLDIWRDDHARELPKKLVFVGNPNLDTAAGENIKMLEYSDYFDEKFIQAVKGERLKAFIE